MSDPHFRRGKYISKFFSSREREIKKFPQMHAILVHEGCVMNYIVLVWDKIKMKWLSFLNLLQTISSYSSDWAIFLNKKLCITCALIIWLMSSAASHFFSCSILFTKKIYKSNKFIALFNTLWQLISFV